MKTEWKPATYIEILAVEIGHYFGNWESDLDAYEAGLEHAKFITDFVLGY